MDMHNEIIIGVHKCSKNPEATSKF